MFKFLQRIKARLVEYSQRTDYEAACLKVLHLLEQDGKCTEHYIITTLHLTEYEATIIMLDLDLGGRIKCNISAQIDLEPIYRITSKGRRDLRKGPILR